MLYSSNLPGFEPPVEVLADEEERGEEEHVDEVGGDAVRVVQHHPDDPRHRLGAAQAQDVPVQPEMGIKLLNKSVDVSVSNVSV